MTRKSIRIQRNAAAFAALLATSALFSEDDDARLARRLLADGAILPLSHFIDYARSLRAGVLIDAELHFETEHQAYVYEMHMLDAAGTVWEMEFDAATGRMLENEHADH
jgi:uncharacterized membrane protein YkoI